jgi:hypothetical protein
MKVKFADRKGGFPHSEICGSKGARASPHLIAACHVLHRLSTPRHPLEALSRLIVLSKTHARQSHRSEERQDGRHQLCSFVSQTMMSSIRSALANACAYGLTLHSRCQTCLVQEDLTGIPCSRSRGSLFRLHSRRPASRSALGREGWWSQTGSNRRPHACKARALPTELWPPL